MFRELRRPRGDPNVLAAQSREQYYKVYWVATKFLILAVAIVVPPMVILLSHTCLWRIFILQLKKKLQVLTLGIGGIGLVSAYVSYSPEIAARWVDLLNIRVDFIFLCFWLIVILTFCSLSKFFLEYLLAATYSSAFKCILICFINKFHAFKCMVPIPNILLWNNGSMLQDSVFLKSKWVMFYWDIFNQVLI